MKKEQIVDELLRYFQKENYSYCKTTLPSCYEEKRKMLRGLINLREPLLIPQKILDREGLLLELEKQEKQITDVHSFSESIVLWRGDITTLQCDVIVNAGNEYMLGCFYPNHDCIDNQIHSNAGISLRLCCQEIMKGKHLENGEVILTKGFHLPARYIIHTVGPKILHQVTEKDREDLKNCYLHSLELAKKEGAKSIAFPCISTGVYRYPSEEAAKIAYETVLEYSRKNSADFEHIVFNVFTKEDQEIYERLLEG